MGGTDYEANRGSRAEAHCPPAHSDADESRTVEGVPLTDRRRPNPTARESIPAPRRPRMRDAGEPDSLSPALESDDGVLLRRHLSGDSQAFATLVRRHETWMWTTARALLNNREDATDAVQQAFIRAFRSAHTWRADGPVSSWLHRILARVVLDLYAARARTPIPVDTAELSPNELCVPDDSDAVMAERILQNLIASLPIDQRECFVRTDVLGFAPAEVAAELGIPEGTVKSRRARGKTRLLDALRAAQLLRDRPGRQQSADTPRADGGEPGGAAGV